MEIFGPPLASFIRSFGGRLDLNIHFDDLEFLCAEAGRKGKLTSVGKIGEGRFFNVSHFYLPTARWKLPSAYGKEAFDLIFQALPELKASNFVFGLMGQRDVSGLVTSLLSGQLPGSRKHEKTPCDPS